MRKLFHVLKDSITSRSKHNGSVYAAGVSFYAFFSMAPLLLIVLSVAGIVFGEAAAKGELMNQISGLVGERAASLIQAMLASAGKSPVKGEIGALIGLLLALVGASAVFLHLQAAFNAVWEVGNAQIKGGLKWLLLKRLISFAMVIGIGILLIISLIAQSVLAAVTAYLQSALPGTELLWSLLNFFLSFALLTFFFGIIFQYLPDVDIKWGTVWFGAALTALLFNIGKSLIGLYIGSRALGPTYGAASSIVVLLLWIFYSSQIVLFGAEITRQVSLKYGDHR